MEQYNVKSNLIELVYTPIAALIRLFKRLAAKKKKKKK